MRKYWLFLFPALLTIVACGSPRNISKREPNGASTELSRYSRALGVPLPEGINEQYIKAVTPWLGTPYRYGGSSKSGVDCSGFVQQIYGEVFGIKLERNSARMREAAKPVSESNLKEGDLVFFKIDGKKVSHVGMHITGKAFIHASTKKGVMVNTLDEEYYRKSFAGYGAYR